jgi:hypothetical protein
MVGRPQKNNADYFTHDKDMRDDPKIKALRRKHGLEGYAIYVMLLEVLTDSDYFVHNYDELSIELLSGDFGIETELLKSVIDYCVKLNLIVIDNETLRNYTLEKRFEPLLSKRERDRERIIASENTQSKVEYSKEEKRTNKDSVILNDKFTEFWELYPTTRRREKVNCKTKFITKCRKAKDSESEAKRSIMALTNYLKSKDFAKDNYDYFQTSPVFINKWDLDTWLNIESTKTESINNYKKMDEK